MRILAMDTSTSSCSVALWQEGRIKAQRFVDMARGQSEALVPMIDDVLIEADWASEDIDLLGVTTGPGAFTGVRIGLATARGLALAIDRPLIGVSTFDALMQGVPLEQRTAEQYLCVIDTKRGDVFFQAFDMSLQDVGEARVASCAEIVEILSSCPEPDRIMLVGDGSEMIIEECGSLLIKKPSTYLAQPQAVIVAEIVAQTGIPAKILPPPAPIYLRPPEVKVSPHGGRLRV